jgi:hypothetical protein
MAAESKPANKILVWQEVIDRIAEDAFVLSEELEKIINDDEEPVDPESFMTVAEFKVMLSEFPDDLRVRLHTQYATNLNVLSCYTSKDEGDEFLEIDIGREEEGE